MPSSRVSINASGKIRIDIETEKTQKNADYSEAPVRK